MTTKDDERKMSQQQIKQLAKLLKLWEQEFDDDQPMYARVVNGIRHDVQREIESQS